MRTVILVPHRPDGGHRDRLWGFTRTWLERYGKAETPADLAMLWNGVRETALVPEPRR